MEDVVSQNERNLVIADELFTDDECLREAVRRWLNSVGKVDAPVRSIAQKVLELSLVARCRDDQDVLDAG